ncbi:MAG TPA: CcmD family protein [Desulfovibrio sp.]|jgi:CcmD family protein|nr:CcmD family protein [Desulfovibrio sp.]
MTEQWIMYAGIAVWIGIGLYTAFIAVKQAALTRKIETLELLGGRGRDRG